MVRGVHTPAKGPLRAALHLGAHLAGNLAHLDGGLKAWKEAGRPVDTRGATP